MRLSVALLLTSLTTSLALPNLKPFRGAITSWLDPFRQLPLPTFEEHHSAEDKSIFDVISNDDRFTKITKAIKFAEGIETILKDSESSVTFFAVPDSALKLPHGDELKDVSRITSLAEALEGLEVVGGLDDYHHDDDKERKKKILKGIVTGILKYHILPEKLLGVDLGKNNTFATNLILPKSFDERALRIRVSTSLTVIPPLPGALTINWYSKVVHQDRLASNGVIHVINRPLLPPPTVFQELFFVPSLFSTLTSAIQRTGLTDVIDLRWERGEGDHQGHLHGSKAATIFAPTNRAFEKLPTKLKFFLFSPFGTRVLRKLLKYHVVPDVIFHTDYTFNATSSDSRFIASPNDDEFAFVMSPNPGLPSDVKGFKKHGKFLKSIGHGHPDHGPISSHHIILPTALENHTIHAQVDKVFIGPRIPHYPRRIATVLKVNHRFVSFPDSVAFNGAVHVIGKVLDPRGHGHHDHDHDHHLKDNMNNWDDWEDWLIKWADEA